ncbi:hypothetical protein Vadar_000166 [Vaccinium darrowii]|uniref:Uncharacterized protein n=1 Tax=Vaccinium darrowii TaxID=229202 RepID=A0ACB7XM09_9ERIC|nr:hypothetical protein Vadar_000166 [Vaccinium darrowii]
MLTLKLRSSGNQLFYVEENVASKALLLKWLFEGYASEKHEGKPREEIPLKGELIALVLRYCHEHVLNEGEAGIDLSAWDAAFVENIQPSTTLLQLIIAANYLSVVDLVNVCISKIRSIISGKTRQQIREALGTLNHDFTDDEKRALRRSFAEFI